MINNFNYHIDFIPSLGHFAADNLRCVSHICPLGAADKQVFSKLDVVGWYATGSAVQDSDTAVHKRVRGALPPPQWRHAWVVLLGYPRKINKDRGSMYCRGMRSYATAGQDISMRTRIQQQGHATIHY